MAIALVAGQTTAGTAATTPLTLTLTNNPAQNDLVAVGFGSDGLSTTTGWTVKDSNNNSYSLTTKSMFANGTQNCVIGIAYLIAPANATKTITIALASGNSLHAWAGEYSGAATASVFENDATALTATASTTINTPSITTVTDGDLMFAACMAGGTISTANSPWAGVGSVQNGNFAEYLVKSAHGLQAVNYTQTSGGWTGILAVFKPAVVAYIPYRRTRTFVVPRLLLK